MMVFKSANGSRITDQEAQQYGERIKALALKNNRTVTPDDVLRDARRKTSPLHDFFEWDDAVAAGKYRTEQAFYLLRSIHVDVKNEDGSEERVRAFYNVSINDEASETTQRVYVLIDRVVSEEELRSQVVEQALRQLIGWQKRYSQYKEFAPIVSAIEEVRERIET